jgi:hypothetical protein
MGEQPTRGRLQHKGDNVNRIFSGHRQAETTDNQETLAYA